MEIELIKPSVTVIVIVYNGEKNISRCIDSIRNQTLESWELIVVNDGSTDSTASIVEDYCKVDNRIHIYNQKNSGVSASRQKGIELATGHYSVHVDSDDWIDPDMLRSLYDRALSSNADIVMCDILVERPKRTELSRQKPKSHDSEIVLGQMLQELHGSVCNKLIKQECYSKYGVSFPREIGCCEDQFVVMKMLSKGASIEYVEGGFYHYDKTQNDSSITNSWLDYPVTKRLKFIEMIEPMMSNDHLVHLFNNYVASVAYTAIASSKKHCPDYQAYFRAYWPRIKSSELLPHKKFCCLLRLMGIPVPIRQVKLLRRYINRLK